MKQFIVTFIATVMAKDDNYAIDNAIALIGRCGGEWDTFEIPLEPIGPRCEHGQFVSCSVCRFDFR